MSKWEQKPWSGMDYLGLRVRYFSGGMNRPRSSLFLLMEEAAAVWYHLAPPCLPDLISSAPVQQVYQQAGFTVPASMCDSDSSLRLVCPHSRTLLGLGASYLLFKT